MKYSSQEHGQEHEDFFAQAKASKMLSYLLLLFTYLTYLLI